ncbi:MAG: mercury methylation corrinoid protein HgcA [Anaerolineae bacterium]
METQLVLFSANTTISSSDRWQHVLARLGYRRDQRRVVPGLYAIGNPQPSSPVFVTANYKLSFDALRSVLTGIDSYILVLETFGINVWCAAGKGTFGTEELIQRIEVTGLAQVVSHRKLILPQLGAPGVSVDTVRRSTGFRATFGPVRAEDLPAYLKTGSATPEMRRVRFNLADRLVVIPLEVVYAALPALVVAIILYFLSGWLASLAVILAVLAGTVLFPILLPWLPTRQFSSKGLFLGGILALGIACWSWFTTSYLVWWQRIGWSLAYLLAMPAVTSYFALNFTGSTTFTSRTGVAREIKRYIPIMAILFGVGIVVLIALSIIRFAGG